jgi:hypothetical protein
MKVIRVEKFQTRKPNRKTSQKPPIHLRGNDWQALLQHDRRTGKLDLRSKEVIQDPGSVKRLLEAGMIDPHGKLTPEARKKCAVLDNKLQNLPLPGAPVLKPSGANQPAATPGKKVGNVSAAHWAVLMKYDRKTGNLLKIDPRTGQLDKTSRSILKNPAIIQRLVEKNLILPGGWLTPEAKRECNRLEKKIKARMTKESTDTEASLERKSKGDSDLEGKSKELPKPEPGLKGGPKPAAPAGRKSGSDRDMQVFFEDLRQDTIVAGEESAGDFGNDFQDDEDWQGFFENLPDDAPEPLDPNILFTYDWKDESDLQAYFENLPRHFPLSTVIARSDRKSAKTKNLESKKKNQSRKHEIIKTRNRKII